MIQTSIVDRGQEDRSVYIYTAEAGARLAASIFRLLSGPNHVGSNLEENGHVWAAAGGGGASRKKNPRQNNEPGVCERTSGLSDQPLGTFLV